MHLLNALKRFFFFGRGGNIRNFSGLKIRLVIWESIQKFFMGALGLGALGCSTYDY